MNLMAVGAVVAAVGFTVGYRQIAGWDTPVSWIGAGLVVGSWLALLHYAPVLIGMLRELMDPIYCEVRRSVGHYAIKVGMRLQFAGARVLSAGLRMRMATVGKKTVEG